MTQFFPLRKELTMTKEKDQKTAEKTKLLGDLRG